MSLIKPTIFADFISSFWVITMAIVFFIWLPISGIKNNIGSRINTSLKENNTIDIWYLGLWLRNILFIIIAVLILGYLNLINWLTLALLYTLCIVINYLKSYGWEIKYLKKAIQSKIINLVDFLDRGVSFTDVLKNMDRSCQSIAQQISDRIVGLVTRRGSTSLVLLTAILGFTLLLRWEYPLSQLRFSHPDNYNTLLITRQLLAKDYPDIHHLPILPSFAAIISLLGSVEPMQAIRFLSPLLGVALVISMGFTIRVFTNNAYSTLTAMFALGVYLFTSKVNSINIEWLNKIVESLNSSFVRQWTGNELELGTVFLLLGLGYCFGCDRFLQKTLAFKANLLCSVILVGICAPPLLIIFAIALIGLIGDKRLTLTAIVLTWITLAVFAAMSQGRLLWLQSFLLTLPVALSLLAGLLFSLISDFSKVFFPQWGEIFCLGLIFSLSINFLLPLAPNLTYVEYDMAARKTLEIKKLFPAQSWSLVAPIEQLAEIYGEGWYQDLALFVEQYADEARKPGFDFPVSTEDTFIMVEKIPFVTFPDEPDILPNELLSDRTYQYYRSAAGRASLEYEAWRMCKAYTRFHSSSSSIYYEDKQLIVYHFAQTILNSDET